MVGDVVAVAAAPEAPADEDDPLLDGVADALAELRLAGHEGLLRSVAGDVVGLGWGDEGDGKMKVVVRGKTNGSRRGWRPLLRRVVRR